MKTQKLKDKNKEECNCNDKDEQQIPETKIGGDKPKPELEERPPRK